MLLATALFLLFFVLAWGGIHLLLPRLWRVFGRALRAFARLVLGRPRLAQWYARRVKTLHPYRRLLAIALVGFLAAVATGAVFLGLAEEVRASSPSLQHLDHHVWELARSHRSPGRTTFFVAFTLLGTPVGLGAVVLLSVAFLVARGHRRLPLFLAGATLGAWALNHVLKALFARARPDLTLALRHTSGYSFPSGHAMMSLVTFGALVYVAARVSHRPREQSFCAALALSIVAAISLSRVYLGVHWTSDIAGGWAAGLVWLAASVGTYEVFRHLRLVRGGLSRAPE